MSKFGGHYPVRATTSMAANTAISKGMIVTVDAAGRAVSTGLGLRCAGIAQFDCNNLTGSAHGGLADATEIDSTYGIHSLDSSDTFQLGDPAYAVSATEVTAVDNGNCCVGYFHELGSDGLKYFDVQHVRRTDVAGRSGSISFPVTDLRQASGVTVLAFTDGSADGIAVSEGVMHRWNVASTNARWASFDLPEDLDDSQDIVLHMTCSREGTADVTAALTVGAFFAVDGAAYDADNDAGGASGAVDNAATKVVQTVTRTIAAADVPAGPCVLNVSLVPTAALDADDLNLHALRVSFVRKG